MKTIDIIKNITAIIVLLGMLFGGYTYIDEKYVDKEALAATKAEVVDILKSYRAELNKDRLEQNYITTMNLERQYRTLMIQYPNDKNIKIEYKQIVKDREEMKRKLDELRGLR